MSRPGRDRFDVLGVGVSALTRERAVTAVTDLVVSGTKGYLVFGTVSSVLSARRDPRLGEAMARAALVTPDGMPLVWLGRRAAAGPVERVYGPDFMIDLITATGGGLRHFFYGAAPGVAEELATRLCDRVPDLVVSGTHSPPPDLDPFAVPDDDIEIINRAEPDVVWVGLGHPKQDLFMYANHDRIDAPVLAGVGAAFDFLSGRKKEAPEWIKRSGLQWLHRLLSEPKRLWRRYLIGNTVFIALLLRERLFRRRRLPWD